jgi:hypothetical protein
MCISHKCHIIPDMPFRVAEYLPEIWSTEIELGFGYRTSGVMTIILLLRLASN